MNKIDKIDISYKLYFIINWVILILALTGIWWIILHFLNIDNLIVIVLMVILSCFSTVGIITLYDSLPHFEKDSDFKWYSPKNVGLLSYPKDKRLTVMRICDCGKKNDAFWDRILDLPYYKPMWGFYTPTKELDEEIEKENKED